MMITMTGRDFSRGNLFIFIFYYFIFFPTLFNFSYGGLLLLLSPPRSAIIIFNDNETR